MTPPRDKSLPFGLGYALGYGLGSILARLSRR